MNTDHVKIGTIVSKHGYKGFIKINVSSFNFDQIPDIKYLFIDINNCFIPFMIEEIKSFLNVSSFNFDQIPDIKYLFIDINNCFIPFMIEEIKSF